MHALKHTYIRTVIFIHTQLLVQLQFFPVRLTIYVVGNKAQIGVITVQFRRTNLQLGRKNLDILCNLHAHTHSLKTPVNAGMTLVHLQRILMYTGKLIKNTCYWTENKTSYYHRLKLTMISIRSQCCYTHESGMSFNIVGMN